MFKHIKENQTKGNFPFLVFLLLTGSRKTACLVHNACKLVNMPYFKWGTKKPQGPILSDL